MAVQRAYLDYLRLASWHDASALKLTAQLRRAFPKWRDGYWLQYHGWYADNAFYGIGEQNRKRHYIWRVSGNSSSVLYEAADFLGEIYATRLDVQVTIPLPDGYSAFEVYQDHKELLDRGTTIIESDTGSTIYFGSRVSDRFARMYTKEYEEGKFLRLEFEFKGKTAKALYFKMKSGIGPTEIFQHYLKSFGLVDYIIEWFETGFDGEKLRLEIEKNENSDNKIAWLYSLSNAVIKMGNDHDIGDITKNILREWIKAIDENAGLT